MCVKSGWQRLLETRMARQPGFLQLYKQLAKSMGSLQRSGGGVSPAALQAQLAAANVQVHSAACGTDGMAVQAICGALDGKIGIFEIPPVQSPAAAAAGFTLLSTLPAARTIPCA